jgi:hypothetical protein
MSFMSIESVFFVPIIHTFSLRTITYDGVCSSLQFSSLLAVYVITVVTTVPSCYRCSLCNRLLPLFDVPVPLATAVTAIPGSPCSIAFTVSPFQ